MSSDTIRRQNYGAQSMLSALALILLLGAGCSKQEDTSMQEAEPAQAPMSEMTEAEAPPPIEPPAASEPPAESAEPVEQQAEAEAPTETAAAAVDGQKIYEASCQACHVAGVAGAPKLGDKDAWAPRLAKGNDAMLASVLNGLNAMPPKGGCMSCSEEELRAAMEYIVEQGS